MATKRQKAVAKIVCNLLKGLKNPTGFTNGKALKQAGYSNSVCNKPSIVTRSKGFLELVTKEFPNYPY